MGCLEQAIEYQQTLNKSEFLKSLFGPIILLAIALFITGAYCCGRCFLDPCQNYPGSFLLYGSPRAVYHISKGMGFQLVISSIFILAHSAHNVLTEQHVCYMTGSMIGLAVITLGLFAQWFCVTVQVLEELPGDHVDTGLLRGAQCVGVCSFFICVGYVTMLMLIGMWSDELCAVEASGENQNFAQHAEVKDTIPVPLSARGGAQEVPPPAASESKTTCTTQPPQRQGLFTDQKELQRLMSPSPNVQQPVCRPTAVL